MKRFLFFLSAGLLLGGCGTFFFHPLETHVRTPDALGLAYQDVWFDSIDGTKLHAWFLPARGQALGTVLFFHGNAENISTHIRSVSWLPERQFNVFLTDYRGYGKSQGKPDIRGLNEDGTSAIRYLVEKSSVKPDSLIVFGQSLGGSVAIYSVAKSAYRNHIRALVIEAAFSGYRQILRDKLGEFWLTWPFKWPLSFTVSDQFSALPLIDQVTPIPLRIIHAEKDPIVPVYHAKKLYQAAGEPKELLILPEESHIDAFSYARNRESLIVFLKKALKTQ